MVESIPISHFSLSAEVGRFFSPDGQLDEAAFRLSLRDQVNNIAVEHRPDPDPRQRWDLASTPEVALETSAYIQKIIAYVSDKGMPAAAYRLFKIAVDESIQLGLEELTVSSAFINRMLRETSAASSDNIDDKVQSQNDMRQKIFQAALQVIGKKGFHKAKMEEIATESGVGKGSLYRYFKNKEDLLNQLLIDKYSMITERFSQLFSPGGDILLQIQQAVEFYMHFIEENPIAYRLIQNETISPQRENKITFYDYMARHLPMLKERVVALNRERKLKTTDFYTVFYGIFGFMDGVAQKWFIAGMNYPLKNEVPLVLEVLFNGFVGETTTRRYFYQKT